MSGLINFIKSLFSGFFGFFGGLFGGKKSNDASNSSQAKKGKGYFLELDEAQGTKASAPTTPAPTAAPKTEGTAASAPAPSTRKEKLAALAQAADQPAAPVAAPSAPAPAPVATVKKPEPTEVNFATKYLVPSNTTSRRRPGANMTTYLDMARKVKA